MFNTTTKISCQIQHAPNRFSATICRAQRNNEIYQIDLGFLSEQCIQPLINFTLQTINILIDKEQDYHVVFKYIKWKEDR